MYNNRKVIEGILARIGDQGKRILNLESYEDRKAGAHIYKTASQTGILGAWNDVIFQAALWDTHGFFAASGDNFFTVPFSGRYYIHAHLSMTWAAAPTQYDYRFDIAGGTYYYTLTREPNVEAPAIFSKWIDLQTLVLLSAGDTVALDVNITGVNALDIIQSGDPYDSFFQIELQAEL